MKSYRELRVWDDSMDLAVQIYEITTTFPKYEQYGLGSQMQRAAVSIPSNIAEGNSRHSTKENLHHLRYALGSLSELTTQIELSFRLHYFVSEQKEKLMANCDIVGKKISNLVNSLQRLVE